MIYPLTPVPYSIATADGYLVKTVKIKSLQHLVKDIVDADVPAPGNSLAILDGNAFSYWMKEVPGKFHQICIKVFDMMTKYGDVVYSPDTYKPQSVKSLERQW